MTKIYLLRIHYGKHFIETLYWEEEVAQGLLFAHMEANWPDHLERTDSKYSDLPRFRLNVVGVYGSFDVDILDMPEERD